MMKNILSPTDTKIAVPYNTYPNNGFQSLN